MTLSINIFVTASDIILVWYVIYRPEDAVSAFIKMDQTRLGSRERDGC